MPVLLERLRHLPSNTIVIQTSINQDAAGRRFISSAQSVPLVAGAANAPVFVMDDVDLRAGTVGGSLVNWPDDGRVAGEIAVRILNGKRPEDIPIVMSNNVYMFDWSALKRWGLKESNLPPGSVVLNRQATFWELYKRYVITGISLILLEAFLIFALLVQRARRRDAENTLAITNDRLRTAIDSGKFVGWDFNVKAGQNHWFGDLQGVFGIPSHTYSADIDEFRKRVHPEDRDAVVQAIEKAKETREPYVAEFRVNRNDGEVRWIIAQGKFHYSSNGIPERMLGLAVDITERKLAEDALASLSGQLIEAQEDERKRIARELHDDYNQRLAMMAIDLQRLAENIGDSSPDAAQQLYELFNRVSEVGADLHSLSHSLHSSTLESLGLVAGVKGFCKEFAEQQGIQVDFVHENIPRGIPGDAALCMFRIAQEALRNVKKHSGADKAGVRLEWLGGRLHLSVIDSGKGFDLTQPAADHGIGVHSMEERLRVLGGRLEIKSHPMRGTRVDAWLPFNVTSQHVS
jgi:signal transduction histidine kinase